MAFWNRNRGGDSGRMPDPAKAVKIDRNVTVYDGPGAPKANAPQGTGRFRPQARRSQWEELPRDTGGDVAPMQDDWTNAFKGSSWKPGDEDGY